MSLKIIFAGTPEFAVPSLETLVGSKHQVVAVYTQPDRPAGRGRQVQASIVKQAAQSHQIPVFQPKTLRDSNAQNEMRAIQADVIVVVAYGLILPEPVLTMTRLGCINVHPSLLPRWRGAAPIPRAIEAGDKETGICIMQLDAGMDTGPVLKQEHYRYFGDETSGEIHDLLSQRGAALLLDTLTELELGICHPEKQDDALATHAAKIKKEEAVIDWTLSATQINNKIRAFNPWPVANTTFAGTTLRIFEAHVLYEPVKFAPGTFIEMQDDKLCVATGQDVLAISSVQLPSKRIMSAADLFHGHSDSLIPGKTKLGK